ncbi:hypothetical protein MCHI_002785 [Candidatus Magnetoovum chiemensis]|nr:hypothetical protein MCHI_002785 [Candidatus Magnetoovum chiemensis]
MAVVKNSITLSFSTICATDTGLTDEENKDITVEPDEDRNEGKTCFAFGEKYYFDVFTIPPDMAITLSTTDGAVKYEGEFTKQVTEQVVFTTLAADEENSSNNADTAKYIQSLDSVTFYGADLGALTKIGSKTVKCANFGHSVAEITYTTTYRLYSVTCPPRDTSPYPIDVLVMEENA